MILDVIFDLQPGDLILDGLHLTSGSYPVMVTAVRPEDPVDGTRWIDVDVMLATGERLTPCELRRGTQARLLRKDV